MELGPFFEMEREANYFSDEIYFFEHGYLQVQTTPALPCRHSHSPSAVVLSCVFRNTQVTPRCDKAPEPRVAHLQSALPSSGGGDWVFAEAE